MSLMWVVVIFSVLLCGGRPVVSRPCCAVAPLFLPGFYSMYTPLVIILLSLPAMGRGRIDISISRATCGHDSAIEYPLKTFSEYTSQ